MLVQSFEEACAVRGYPTDLPTTAHLPEGLRKPIEAVYKLMVITEAINTREDGTLWVPDYSNGEEKWELLFNMDGSHPSGFGLHYCFWGADSVTGSRLCYRSKEIAEYAATQFLEEYKQFFLIQNSK